MLDCTDVKFVRSLDVSGCCYLDPTSVIDICELFESLTHFVYRDCTKFKETHLLRICDLCQNLKYIDGKGAGTVSATYALGIIYNLPRLCKFGVMPLAHEVGAWQFIFFQYSRIIFAECIADTLECDGTTYRFAKNALKSIYEL